MHFSHNCIAYHRGGQYFISQFVCKRDLRQLSLDEKLGMIEAMFGVELAKSFEALHQEQTSELCEMEEELELEEVEEEEEAEQPVVSYAHL